MKNKSILLVGVGRLGRYIAEKLNELGHEVMAIDHNESRINDVMDIVTNAQIGDSTNETFLKSLGVENYDVCMVTIGGDFQASLETTNLLKELGAKMVVSRAERDGQAKFLKRNGADEIIYQGAIDLLAVGEQVRIIDYKYSSQGAEYLKKHYAPQMQLYRMAIAKSLKMDENAVRCTIVNIKNGVQVDVE